MFLTILKPHASGAITVHAYFINALIFRRCTVACVVSRGWCARRQCWIPKRVSGFVATLSLSAKSCCPRRRVARSLYQRVYSGSSSPATSPTRLRYTFYPCSLYLYLPTYKFKFTKLIMSQTGSLQLIVVATASHQKGVNLIHKDIILKITLNFCFYVQFM